MQNSNRIIENGVIGCLFLIAMFAPHSIAVTQTAWLVGMALWLLRFAIYPRPQLFRSPVDFVLIGFFVLSGISGVFSYNPIMSIGKMRAASLFTIVYLVCQNVRSLRVAHMLALTLIGMAGCFAGAKLFRWDAQQRFAAHNFGKLDDAGDVRQTVRQVGKKQNATGLIE